MQFTHRAVSAEKADVTPFIPYPRYPSDIAVTEILPHRERPETTLRRIEATAENGPERLHAVSIVP